MPTFDAPPSGPLLGSDLHPGEIVDRYVVERLLGRGGMASVYLVRHRQLGTRHALKVLNLPTRVIEARLLQEGRIQGSLNHPSVVSVTDVVDVAGSPGLVMEYVPGPTLRDLLHQGRLDADHARRLGADVIRGVAAAHRHGLIHRDIKPANVLLALRDDLLVAKVADFGLAKLLDSPHPADPNTRTESGIGLGTPAYMAPEQIRDASRVDSRADIFSLGALLYELATGHRAFAGQDPLTVMTAICEGRFEPPAALDPELPPEIVATIEGALQVDRELRTPDCPALLASWLGDVTQARESQAVHGFRVDPRLAARVRGLAADDDTIEATPVSLPRPSQSQRALDDTVALTSAPLPSTVQPILPARRSWRWPALLGSLAVAAGLAWPMLSRGPAPPLEGLEPRLTRMSFEAGLQAHAALSPDGRQLIYSDLQDLFLRRVEGRRVLPLTEHFDGRAIEPSFSPDGERIAFASDDGLYVMGATGEQPRKVSDEGHWPTWSPDGEWLAFATRYAPSFHDRASFDSALKKIRWRTGEIQLVTEERDAAHLAWSPDGDVIVFSGGTGTFAVSADGGPTHELHVGSWSPRWLPDGSGVLLLTNRGDSTDVMFLPMEGLEPSGEPRRLFTSAGGFGETLTVSAGDNPRWAISSYRHQDHLLRWNLDPVSGAVSGAARTVPLGDLPASNPALRPDGKLLAFTSTGQREDLYTVRLDGSELTQLSKGSRFTRGPRWAPDNDYLAFYGFRAGHAGIWQQRADGGDLRSPSRHLGLEPGLVVPVFSPDGSRMAATNLGKACWIFDMDRKWSNQDAWHGPSDGLVALDWSPDGHWLLLGDGEGRLVRRSVDGDQQDELGTGWDARWLPDSRRAVIADGAIVWLHDTQTGERRELLDLSPARAQSTLPLALSADARTLLVATDQREADTWLVDWLPPAP